MPQPTMPKPIVSTRDSFSKLPTTSACVDRVLIMVLGMILLVPTQLALRIGLLPSYRAIQHLVYGADSSALMNVETSVDLGG